jgi:hypothetical protein
VRRLVGNLNHPVLGVELQEPDPPKRLVEQVCKLVLGVDVACLDAPFLQTTSDEVVPHLYVLAPFIENGVLGQGQSGLAVPHCCSPARDAVLTFQEADCQGGLGCHRCGTHRQRPRLQDHAAGTLQGVGEPDLPAR